MMSIVFFMNSVCIVAYILCGFFCLYSSGFMVFCSISPLSLLVYVSA